MQAGRRQNASHGQAVTAGTLLLSLWSWYVIFALWFIPSVRHHCSNMHNIINFEPILYVLKFAVTLL